MPRSGRNGRKFSGHKRRGDNLLMKFNLVLWHPPKKKFHWSVGILFDFSKMKMNEPKAVKESSVLSHECLTPKSTVRMVKAWKLSF